MNQFAVGQRWLSENETELGLGMIQAIDHRLITIFFPGSEETRTYSKDSAPLARYVLEPGDNFETLDGDTYPISSVESLNDILIYMVTDDSGQTAPLPETQLAHQLQLAHASDRLFSGQLDSVKWFQLRHQALQARSQQERSQIFGLQGPRVELLPHQLYIANEVGTRYQPRVLLADEVGLGKTIEAGLIIHQQLISQRAQRVLIIVPPALINQWFVEMIRRFNLHFHMFDEDRIQSLSEIPEEEENNEQWQIDNPFLSEQLVICDIDFVTRCDSELLLNGEWDMVVVDEAHHLEWQPGHPGLSYQKVEMLARKVPGLLLLSATPEQLGQQSHFARLRLLDEDRFPDFDKFIAEQEAYLPIAELIEQLLEQLLNSEDWDDKLIEKTRAYIADTEITAENKDAIIGELLDRNGTGRVLYRNTRRNIEGFPKRKLHSWPLPKPEQYEFEIADHVEQTINLALHPESQYEDESWCQFDPRVDWLKQFLKDNRQQKVLVICAHKNTAINLDLYCRFRLGFNSSTFHEGMDLIARDRAAAHFADQEDGAQVLFCSEIGSEGRNFQFANQLVLMDLPINPDLLEQRIGRLDRIGQQQDIDIHIPYLADSAQQLLFNWYHHGMSAFEKTNTAGSLVFEKTRAQLIDALLNPDIESLEKGLLEATQKLNQQFTNELEKGKDKLLELASFKPEQAEQLVEHVAERDALAPVAIMQEIWDRFGVETEEHSEQAIIVRPGNHMFMGSFPSLPEDGITATFDRQTALSRDDIQFLNWEHPMVSGALEMVLGEDKGNASVCILQNKSVKAGTMLVEVLFKLESLAPHYLQAQRFMPFTAIRLLVDAKGNDLAAKVSFEALSRQCKKLDKNMSRQVIKSEQNQIKTVLKKATEQAQQQGEALKAACIDKMQKHQHNELQRLRALQQRNPNIRPSELKFLQRQTELLDNWLSQSKVQLDAIRIIVAV